MIRDALPADAPAVRAVAARAWPAAYEGLFEPAFIEAVVARTYAVEAIREHIADPGSVFLVACDGDAVTGFLHYGAGELHRLYVEPELVGRGIGAALLEELNSRLPAGTEYVALVREGNERALHFYDRHGFERAGLVDGFAHFAEREGYRPEDSPRGGRDVLVRYVVR